jgi:hypothetical protein
MFRNAHDRPVIVLHNYCGSDGMLKWLRGPYRRVCSAWPLAMASCAGELEGAVPTRSPSTESPVICAYPRV